MDKPDIIYEDKNILAVYKPAGIATQTASVSQPDIVSMTAGYLRSKEGSGKGDPHIGLINRLDQPVEGIVLMGLDRRTTALLSDALKSGNIRKRYYACAVSTSEEVPDEITLTDYLYHDRRSNLTSVVTGEHSGAKEAELRYRIIKRISAEALMSVGEWNEPAACRTGRDRIYLNLADIELVTGRHHQIRAQMANAGLPLLGDMKYAPDYVQSVSKLLKVSGPGLCAYGLCFTHPLRNDIIDLQVEPRGKWYGFF